jgi:hypothetical protein
VRGASTTIVLMDTDSGKELLALPLRTTGNSPFGAGPPGAARLLTFTGDGHRLLHFDVETRTRAVPGPDGANRVVTQTGLRVTTWDATPLPEAKGP